MAAELTLVAVPLIEANPPQEGENKGDVEIILADTATGRPISVCTAANSRRFTAIRSHTTTTGGDSCQEGRCRQPFSEKTLPLMA